MMTKRMLAGGLALLAVPVLARAQDQTAPAAPPVAAAEAAPVDPARLAAARQTVDYVFPPGTYARLMNGSMQGVMASAMDGVYALPMSDLAAMGGIKPEDMGKLGKGTLGEMMAILDPAYRERMRIMTATMMTEMSAMMSEVEPGMRDGLAHAYARRFDAGQLGELNGFFATPTGKAYAADSMMIFMDPEVMVRVQAFVPLLMQRMPAIMQKVEAATARLPAPKKPEDLSAADQAKLAGLMGVPPEQLAKKAH